MLPCVPPAATARCHQVEAEAAHRHEKGTVSDQPQPAGANSGEDSNSRRGTGISGPTVLLLRLIAASSRTMLSQAASLAGLLSASGFSAERVQCDGAP